MFGDGIFKTVRSFFFTVFDLEMSEVVKMSCFLFFHFILRVPGFLNTSFGLFFIPPNKLEKDLQDSVESVNISRKFSPLSVILMTQTLIASYIGNNISSTRIIKDNTKGLTVQETPN